MDFVGNATPLDEDDIELEAKRLGCESAVIRAVCDVESGGSGFLRDGRPKILYEAHVFSRLTDAKYNRSHPNISSRQWDRSLYGAPGAHQYDRLDEAIELNRRAAMESASWGKFQIMGFNCKAAGYPNVEVYVTAMMDDEANHLTAFGNFCNSNNITRDLIRKDWEHFALRYNGAGNVPNYSRKLAAAYRKHARNDPPPSPIPIPKVLKKGDKGTAVVALQQQLVRLEYPIRVDGDFGSQTESAVKIFQDEHGLKPDGIVGPITQAALKEADTIGGPMSMTMVMDD